MPAIPLGALGSNSYAFIYGAAAIVAMSLFLFLYTRSSWGRRQSLVANRKQNRRLSKEVVRSNIEKGESVDFVDLGMVITPGELGSMIATSIPGYITGMLSSLSSNYQRTGSGDYTTYLVIVTDKHIKVILVISPPYRDYFSWYKQPNDATPLVLPRDKVTINIGELEAMTVRQMQQLYIPVQFALGDQTSSILYLRDYEKWRALASGIIGEVD